VISRSAVESCLSEVSLILLERAPRAQNGLSYLAPLFMFLSIRGLFKVPCSLEYSRVEIAFGILYN